MVGRASGAQKPGARAWTRWALANTLDSGSRGETWGEGPVQRFIQNRSQFSWSQTRMRALEGAAQQPWLLHHEPPLPPRLRGPWANFHQSRLGKVLASSLNLHLSHSRKMPRDRCASTQHVHVLGAQMSQASAPGAGRTPPAATLGRVMPIPTRSPGLTFSRWALPSQVRTWVPARGPRCFWPVRGG